MITVSRSVYEPSPIFIVQNPLFFNKVSVRLWFMKGLADTLSLDNDERNIVLRRELKDCILESPIYKRKVRR